MKRVWLLLLLTSCGANQEKVKPLAKIDHFAVMPVICSANLDYKILLEQFTVALEKIGTVSTDQMTPVPACLILWLGNIAEGKLGEKVQYFPVIWGSLQVPAPVTVLSNHASADCNIWRQDLYFEEEESKEITTAKAVPYIQDLVQRFHEDYIKANGVTARPHFYIASIEGKVDGDAGVVKK
ncbi:MAG: hypothetical protein V4494_05370 [Chlamydiota bacterium]